MVLGRAGCAQGERSEVRKGRCEAHEMCSRGQTGWLWAVSGTAIAEAVEACDRGTRTAAAVQSGDVTVD